MNRVKSVFIGVYPMVAMAIIGYAGFQIYQGNERLAWVGPLLTTVPFLALIGWVMTFKNVARTSANFPLLNVVALGGVALAATGGVSMPLALAGVGAFTFALYSMWYSSLGRTASRKLAVGARLPELQLKKADGQAVNWRDFDGQPLLIFFYRGNWCPLCMAQVKEVAGKYRELRELGVRVLLISPQPERNTKELASRFKVPFDFLVDEGNRVARQLDIAMKNGLPMGFELLGYKQETVFPTVMIVDAGGVIRWVDQTDNYRVRPEPETFIGRLKELSLARPALKAVTATRTSAA